MITGHLGIAAAAGVVRRELSLVWLVVASLIPDLVDVGFAVVSGCNPYGLYSHSVPAATLIAGVLGGAAYLATGNVRAGLLTAFVVLLHLPMDFLTGRKLYWPGGELLGLQWYARPLLDFSAESALVVAGWWLLRRTPGAPPWATSTLGVAALLLVQGVFNLVGREVKPNACASSPSVAVGRSSRAGVSTTGRPNTVRRGHPTVAAPGANS